jgi:uncharacterized protein (TIGR03792 family)
MVIEQLRFSVPVSDHARFIAEDARIWTKSLAAQPGFIGKAIWSDHATPETLLLVISWNSREEWHAVPRTVLDDTDRRFNQAMGVTYPVLACIDYDVLA